MNKVFLIGNLTRDPSLATSSNGIQYCRFSIAVSRKYSQNNEVDFFNVTTWRKQAENCSKYLTKGSKIALSGSVQNQVLEKDGEKITYTSISADEVVFLDTKKAEFTSSNTSSESVDTNSKFEPIETGDDLPF